SSVLHLQSQEIEPRRRLRKRAYEVPTGDIVWIWNCVHLIADISRGADIDAEGHRWSGRPRTTQGLARQVRKFLQTMVTRGELELRRRVEPGHLILVSSHHHARCVVV